MSTTRQNADSVSLSADQNLMAQIERAMAKFDADRENCLRVRFERAHRYNAAVVRADRAANARRYLNAGDRP